MPTNSYWQSILRSVVRLVAELPNVSIKGTSPKRPPFMLRRRMIHKVSTDALLRQDRLCLRRSQLAFFGESR
jgi:hypothetical protein